MKKVLIVGALSAIAQETARCFASAGARIYLIARDEKKLETCAADLRARGASFVAAAAADLDLVEHHEGLVSQAERSLEGLDAVLIAYGFLPDQELSLSDFKLVQRTFQTNALSAISWSMLTAARFEAQRGGVLAVIGSVAGDRGRYKNHVYSAAKSAIAVYLQGLRARLSRAGVCVLTIKPGFVDTPMTAGLKKNKLFADAPSVGRSIYRAMVARKDIAYVPWFWRWIMFIVCSIPEVFFKRLKL